MYDEREREEVVVVEHRVERLDPLGVDVAVADNPRAHLGRLAHDLARGGGEHAVEPLARVHVHVAEQLLARHALRVHHVRGDLLPELGERRTQHVPDRRLAASGGADDDDAHPLHRRLVELEDLAHLEREDLELLVGEYGVDGRLEVVVVDVGDVGAGEDVGDDGARATKVSTMAGEGGSLGSFRSQSSTSYSRAKGY